MRAAQALTLAATVALAGCHRGGLPPRPDGAAVVVTAEQTDDGVPTVAEVEPNDTVAAAQRLALTETTAAAVAGDLRPRGAKRDADLYLAADARPRRAVPPTREARTPGRCRHGCVLRVDLRPGAGLAVALDALDEAGHVLVTAAGGAGEADRDPEPGGRRPARSPCASGRSGPKVPTPTYRLAARLAAFDTGAEIEPNGDAAHATDLALGGEAVGYLGWHRDQDWYRLATGGVADGSVLSADLDPVAEVAATLQLFGADGHKLSEARGHKGERVALRNVRIPRRRSGAVRGGSDGRRLERVGALQPAPARRAAAPRLRGRAERRHRARAARRGRHRARVPGARRRGRLPLHDGGDRAAGRRGRAAREGERAGRVAARGRNAAGARRQRSPRPGAHQRRVDPWGPGLHPRLAAPRSRERRRALSPDHHVAPAGE